MTTKKFGNDDIIVQVIVKAGDALVYAIVVS